jgi:hypothetical protein
MPRPCLWPASALVLVVGLTGFPGATLRAQTAVALCPAWRRPIPSTTFTNIWASWWLMPG